MDELLFLPAWKTRLTLPTRKFLDLVKNRPERQRRIIFKLAQVIIDDDFYASLRSPGYGTPRDPDRSE
jgi:hypothetical protein